MGRYHPFLQVFSVTVLLNGQKCPHVVLSVDADGNIVGMPSNSEGKTVRVYGTIKVIDGDLFETFIYNRAKENPEVINNVTANVTASDTLSLIAPSQRCPCAQSVDVVIDLKDADQGLEISRGFITYAAIQPSCPIAYYDKRLSAVIQGTHGSSTVFFSIFEEAIQTSIAIKMSVESGRIDSTNILIYGSVFARYGGHDYSNDYLKNRYQIVLFKRSSDNGILLVENEDIPLSIPMVAVPWDTPLIIIADLHVICCGSEIASVCSEAEFPEPDDIDTPRCIDITGIGSKLEVKVTWSCYPY